jgi:hypothetical protein
MRFSDIKIVEMAALTGGASDDKYLPALQTMIDNGAELFIGTDGSQGTFIADKGQKITNRMQMIKGKLDGEPTEVKVSSIYKSADMKAAQSGKQVDDRIANKGEIVEGIYGAATMARLINRPNASITPKDVYSIINRLPETAQGGSVTINAEESQSDITDNFELIVKLKPQPYADLKNTKKIEAMMGNIVRSVTAFVNNETIPRYAKLFAENGRPDSVDIISDGISDETGTKTDVKLIYKDENGQPVRELIKYGQSVKVGSVKQFGQVGGGKASDSLEKRFEKLEFLWEKFGIDVTPLKQEFMKSNRIEDAYEKIYDRAALILKKQLEGANDDSEKTYMKKFINGIKHFATLNDDTVNLIQFDNKGYFVLDFKRLDKLLDGGADFDVEVQKGTAKSDSSIKLPKITIVDKKSGIKFFSIRMYRTSSGYIRNYIEKEPGLKKITMARSGKSEK